MIINFLDGRNVDLTRSTKSIFVIFGDMKNLTWCVLSKYVNFNSSSK